MTYCPCGFDELNGKNYTQHVSYHFLWSRGLKLPEKITSSLNNVTECHADIGYLRLWRITGQDGRPLNRMAENFSRCLAIESNWELKTPWTRYDKYKTLTFWALEDEGYWVAFLIGQDTINPSLNSKLLSVYYVWTAHAWRRQGYAKALIEAIVQQISGEDYSVRFAWLTPLSEQGKAFALKTSKASTYNDLVLI